MMRCMSIFLSLHVARDLLIQFLKDAKEMYGTSLLTYNVHNLIHIADDVESFGPLDAYSAFPIESCFKSI